MIEIVLLFLSLLVLHYKFGRNIKDSMLDSLQDICNKWNGNWKKGSATKEKVPVSAPVSAPLSVRPSRKISAPSFIGVRPNMPTQEDDRQPLRTLRDRRKISLPNLKQFNNRINVMPGKETRTLSLAHFKSMPTLIPDTGKSRTFMRNGCTKCSPLARIPEIPEEA